MKGINKDFNINCFHTVWASNYASHISSHLNGKCNLNSSVA